MQTQLKIPSRSKNTINISLALGLDWQFSSENFVLPIKNTKPWSWDHSHRHISLPTKFLKKLKSERLWLCNCNKIDKCRCFCSKVKRVVGFSHSLTSLMSKSVVKMFFMESLQIFRSSRDIPNVKSLDLLNHFNYSFDFLFCFDLKRCPVFSSTPTNSQWAKITRATCNQFFWVTAAFLWRVNISLVSSPLKWQVKTVLHVNVLLVIYVLQHTLNTPSLNRSL